MNEMKEQLDTEPCKKRASVLAKGSSRRYIQLLRG